MKRISHYPRRDGPLPPNTKYVGRPTKYGNPYKTGDMHQVCIGHDGNLEVADEPQPITPQMAVLLFADYWQGRLCQINHGRRAEALADLAELAKFDALACACLLTQPCHANVLIELLTQNG